MKRYGYCSPSCQKSMATRKSRHRKNKVLNKLKWGEKFYTRRKSIRKLILRDRIEGKPLDVEMVNVGIAFGLEWTLGIDARDVNEPEDGFYIEWMLNNGYDDHDDLIKEVKNAGLHLAVPEEFELS